MAQKSIEQLQKELKYEGMKKDLEQDIEQKRQYRSGLKRKLFYAKHEKAIGVAKKTGGFLKDAWANWQNLDKPQRSGSSRRRTRRRKAKRYNPYQSNNKPYKPYKRRTRRTRRAKRERGYSLF